MSDDDFEIISHSEIAKLKEQIKELKSGGSSESIKSQLDQMIDIFKEASQGIKDDKPIGEKIGEISDKLDDLLDQNQKIAEGILAVAEMIKSENHTINEIKPFPSPKQMTKGTGPGLSPDRQSAIAPILDGKEVTGGPVPRLNPNEITKKAKTTNLPMPSLDDLDLMAEKEQTDGGIQRLPLRAPPRKRL